MTNLPIIGVWNRDTGRLRNSPMITQSQFHRWAPDPGFGVQVLIFSHTRGHMEIVEEEIESEQLANKKSMAWKELSARVFQAAGKDQRNEEVSQILERVRLGRRVLEGF